jgi:hypothetical protein
VGSGGGWSVRTVRLRTKRQEVFCRFLLVEKKLVTTYKKGPNNDAGQWLVRSIQVMNAEMTLFLSDRITTHLKTLSCLRQQILVQWGPESLTLIIPRPDLNIILN